MNILMPQLGETVAEGKITKWFKAAGDAVQPGDNLFEIETDKVSMEVPAIEAGILSEIRVPEGEVAPVGAIVGVIGNGAGGAASTQATPAAPVSAASKAPAAPVVFDRAPPPAKAPQQTIKLDPFFEVRTPERNFGPARLSGGISVTPLARRLASEAGIDLSR
ncbi:MAG: biotin/lipoyl-containing protein, partial [Xanthobacteraceae bacterium]